MICSLPNIRLLITSFVLMGMTSCAHHRNVRVGSEGVHRVSATGTTPANADRNAMRQAEHFCTELGQSPAYINDSESDIQEPIVTGQAGVLGGTRFRPDAGFYSRGFHHLYSRGFHHRGFYSGALGFSTSMPRIRYHSDLRFICR